MPIGIVFKDPPLEEAQHAARRAHLVLPAPRAVALGGQELVARVGRGGEEAADEEAADLEDEQGGPDHGELAPGHVLYDGPGHLLETV